MAGEDGAVVYEEGKHREIQIFVDDVVVKTSELGTKLLLESLTPYFATIGKSKRV